MAGRRYTILHLDDEEALGRCLQELLGDDGFDIHRESSKSAGYDWAVEHRPDLIISDIHSPGMDGLQFLHWIKRNPVTRRVPFLFLTACADLRTAVQSRKLGVDDFITKPFEYHDLLAAIRRVLASSWSPALYPARRPIDEVLTSGDLELESWNLIDALCRSLPEAWSERICYVGTCGSWASFFMTESGSNLLACCIDRPMHYRAVSAERVLDHHRWMCDTGARYGILMGFFEPDVATRDFARRLGIELLGWRETGDLLRQTWLQQGDRGRSILDRLGFDLSALAGGPAFTAFAGRIEEELARFAGKRFKVFVPVSGAQSAATAVLLNRADAAGLSFDLLSEPGRGVRVERARVWLTLADLWAQGSVDRRLVDPSPEHAACLFEVLGHLPSVDRDDDILRLHEKQSPETRQTVVVLDDDEADRAWTCEFLRRAGYAVIGFELKRDFLELLGTPGVPLPSLIITDLQGADLTGEEFLRTLRSDERHTAIPVMVVSGQPYASDILGNLRHLRVTAFLRKPLEPGGLLQAVDKSVSRERQ